MNNARKALAAELRSQARVAPSAYERAALIQHARHLERRFSPPRSVKGN